MSSLPRGELALFTSGSSNLELEISLKFKLFPDGPLFLEMLFSSFDELRIKLNGSELELEDESKLSISRVFF